MIPLIVSVCALSIVFATVFFFSFRRKRYSSFVLKHSSCLRSLKAINSQFCFYPSAAFNQSHTYDNEKFYETISCKDYLIYQLQFQANEIGGQIAKIKRNKAEYQRYVAEINRLQLGNFSAPTGKLNPKRLLKTEKRLCAKTELPAPPMQFFLTVTLFCAKINGTRYQSKRETFSEDTILALIRRLSDRNGTFYRDRAIWDAICRVERGKVSNKMRFAIYRRDGYRCCKCGVSDRYAPLEIDHIVPIAKGGKSVYDNLQTLCHRCNVEKGDKI